MSEQPKRRFFRFHLLTFLMAIAAGGMLWLCMQERSGSDERGGWLWYGWPFDAAGRLLWAEEPFGFGLQSPSHIRDPFKTPALRFNFMNVTLDCIVAFVTESLIRRCEGRNQ